MKNTAECKERSVMQALCSQNFTCCDSYAQSHTSCASIFSFFVLRPCLSSTTGTGGIPKGTTPLNKNPIAVWMPAGNVRPSLRHLQHAELWLLIPIQ